MTMLREIFAIYLSCLKRSFDYRGRSARSELLVFWGGNMFLTSCLLFALNLVGISMYQWLTGLVACSVVALVLLPTLGVFLLIEVWTLDGGQLTIPTDLPVLFLDIALLLPMQALIVRRMHDLNTSGLWLLYGLVPCLGQIINVILLVILLFTEGEKNTNRFGLPPGTRDPSRCAGCQYDLTGNTSGVCPECGMHLGPATIP